jgi:hypothetical protein
MRKTVLFVACFLIILLSNQVSFGYTINDPVGDRIGNWVFEIYGIDALITPASLTFSLYANYPQTGYTVGSWATFAGDLAIDANNDGTYEYGFALTTHDVFSAGSLYKVTSWKMSNDYAPASGYIYNQGRIVAIGVGEPVPVGSGEVPIWGWIDLAGTGPDWRIDVTLNPGLFSGLGGEIGLYWAAATCANDYVEGTAPVPEPATMLLVGFGLIGLAGYGRRKFKR